MRPLLKGFISFGLITIPVQVFSAESSEATVDLDMLDSKDHSRVRYLRVNEKTGKEVPWESIVKGHKIDDEYVVLEKEDLAEAADNVTRGIEIVEFVKQEEVSPLFFEKPYYTVPAKGGEKGYLLLRDALKDAGVVAIVKMVLHSRQHMGAMMVVDGLLTVVAMRFAEELRSTDEFDAPSTKQKPSPREVDMARKLVADMTVKWKPEQFKNEYHSALMKIIRSKAKGKPRPPIKTEEEDIPPTYNIMELLQQSLSKHGTARRAETGARSAKTKKTTARTVPKRRSA